MRTERNTVDVRGLRVHEAEAAVEDQLRTANGPLWVIHGIGTGVLRNAVQKHLRSHPQVEGQRWGEGHEGGRGVTVARLR